MVNRGSGEQTVHSQVLSTPSHPSAFLQAMSRCLVLALAEHKVLYRPHPSVQFQRSSGRRTIVLFAVGPNEERSTLEGPTGDTELLEFGGLRRRRRVGTHRVC